MLLYVVSSLLHGQANVTVGLIACLPLSPLLALVLVNLTFIISFKQKELITHHVDFASTNVAGFQIGTSVNYVSDAARRMEGMTLLEDQLFVTRYSLSNVLVLNTMTLQFMRALTVAGMSAGPSSPGLVVDAINNLLYIGDNANSQVHRVNLSVTNNSGVLTWGLPGHPNGVSLTRAGNILVVVVVTSNQNKIIEYTPSGSPTGRSITDSSGLFHAVEVESGIWAVSRRGPVHGIAMISTNGTVIKSFGSTAGSGLSQMDTPAGIAIDANGYFIVADMNNNRLLVVDPTLTRARQLIIPDTALQCPRNVDIDQSRGRLYVGENCGQCRVLGFGVN